MSDELKDTTEFKPLYANVIVEMDAKVTKKGSFELPTPEQPARGRVLAVGPGVATSASGKPDKLPVKVGDRLFFKKFSGVPIPWHGREDVFIMSAYEILAVEESSRNALALG